jgi:hypothetical protein
LRLSFIIGYVAKRDKSFRKIYQLKTLVTPGMDFAVLVTFVVDETKVETDDRDIQNKGINKQKREKE